MRALSLIRILDVRQGDDTYVTSLQPEILMQRWASSSIFTRTPACCSCSRYAVLESAAAELAAVLMSDSDADALILHLDALGDDPDIDTLVANDLELHHLIAVGSGNPVLFR